MMASSYTQLYYITDKTGRSSPCKSKLPLNSPLSSYTLAGNTIVQALLTSHSHKPAGTTSVQAPHSSLLIPSHKLTDSSHTNVDMDAITGGWHQHTADETAAAKQTDDCGAICCYRPGTQTTTAAAAAVGIQVTQGVAVHMANIDDYQLWISGN